MITSQEVFAALTDELKDGEKKEITVDETKILLAKANDNFYAVGAVCPHYKAPLVKGALCGTKLYCPWHHSAFDITTGKLCEPPALDGLPVYEVIKKEDGIYVKLPAKETKTDSDKDIIDGPSFIILGGGAAGLMAAQTLREQGFEGKLTMITKEAELPYDRTALSKNFLSGKKKEEELPLRKKEFFAKHKIDVITAKEVKKADVKARKLTLSDESVLSYNTLLIATGSRPQQLMIEGADKKNVFTLCSENDAKKIAAEVKHAKKVCIIGASFIAMETAASLTTLGLQVTVIAKEKLPFEKNFGEEIGKMLLAMHEEKGLVIRTETEIEMIEGNGEAKTVILKGGGRIETDMVIVGIGVKPLTDFIAGIDLDEKDKSVPVDEYLQAADDVFVAGDIAKYKDINTDKQQRIEHWRVAQQQGKMAAMNMLGKQHSVKEIVPFFWTNQFDKRLSYVGHAEDWDTIETEGDVAKQDFLSYYIKDGKVLAVASMNRDMDSNRIEEIFLKNSLLSLVDLKKKMNEQN